MPPAYGSRTERRAYSRDATRHYATTNLGRRQTTGKNRADRRHNGQRVGDIAQAVHAPHDRAWLYSGTLNASGQARINHKRNQRAQYWASFAA